MTHTATIIIFPGRRGDIARTAAELQEAAIVSFPEPLVPQLRPGITDDVLRVARAMVRFIEGECCHETLAVATDGLLDLIDEITNEIRRCRGGNSHGGDVA